MEKLRCKKGDNCIEEFKTDCGIREVPLIPEAAAIIERQRHKNSSKYIFTNTKGNKVTPSAFYKLMERVRKNTGIVDFSMHVLRHTFATEMVEHKADYKALAKILGHSDVAFTMQRYVSAEDDFLREQIMLLSDYSRK